MSYRVHITEKRQLGKLEVGVEVLYGNKPCIIEEIHKTGKGTLVILEDDQGNYLEIEYDN